MRYFIDGRVAQTLFLLSVLSLTLVVSASALANDGLSLPVWRELTFQQRGFGTTARSHIAVAQGDEDKLGAVWTLQIDESIADNSAREVQLLAAGSGQLLRRSRYSSGKDVRYKEYLYAPHRLERIRREPVASKTQPPGEWPISSSREIVYPDMRDGAVLTSMHALLLFAPAVLNAADQTITVYVHGDVNFFRVQLRVIGEAEVKADFSLDGEQQKVSEERSAIVVGLRATPVGKSLGDDRFSLLGLENDVAILLDQQTRIPLQVRGKAPWVGQISADLIAAKMRPTPGARQP